MPNRYKSNCATCQIAKKDVPLRRRIRYAAYKREQGDETLSDIAKEIGVSSPGIYNHVKKHMEDVSDLYKNRSRVQTAKKVTEVQMRVIKEAETVLSKDEYDAVEARPAEIVGLDDYIAAGISKVKQGELKITAQSWLAAIKIKNDWAKGQASTKLDFLKAVYAYASNDKQEQKKYESTPTGEDAGGDEGGSDESDGLYRITSGSEAS